MNLTYDTSYAYSGASSPECCSACHYATANALTSPDVKLLDYVSGDAPSKAALSGFFQDLANTVKTSLVRTNLFPITLTKSLAQGGPSGALQAIKNEGHAFATDIAPIAKPIGAAVSVISPVVGGIISGVGAAANVDVARQKAMADAVTAKASDNTALVQEYAKYIGQVPGRIYGLDNMVKILNAAFATGSIPPAPIDDKGGTKVWADMGRDFVYASGGKCVTSKYNCPPGIYELAKQNPTATPDQLVSAYLQSNPIHAKGMDANENLIFRDIADAALAQVNPNTPYFYGVDAATAPLQSSSPNVPATVSVPPSIAVNTQPILTTSVPPMSAPSPSAYLPAVQQSGIDPQTAAQISTMLAQLQAQGANSAQLQAALAQQLASNGVNMQTPQAQAAIQSLPSVTAGVSGIPTWLAIGGAALAVMLAFAVPHSGSLRSNTRSTRKRKRKRNPRRRRARRHH